MATQQDYEKIASLPTEYSDFKITLRDLPSTDGFLESFLKEYGLPAKKIKIFLLGLLFFIPVIVTAFFLLSHPTIAHLQEISSELPEGY